ncbi:MAG: CHASE2 domain-containing protein, partial [candidate division Zixibacteria bacterium]
MAKYASYILYLLLSVFVVILYVNGFSPIDGMQQSLNDSFCGLTAPDTHSGEVVLVTIDGRTMDEYGQWPWNRDMLADLTAAVAAGEPKVVVLDFDLSSDAAQDSTGNTSVLAGQLSWIKNTVLSYDISLATFQSNLTETPKPLFNNSVSVNNPIGLMDGNASLLTRKVFLPAEKLQETGAGLGFVYDNPDDDRILRHHSLVTHYKGYYYPSQPLLAAALYLNVPPDMIEVNEGSSVKVGAAREIPTDATGKMLLTFAEDDRFARVSAMTVLSDNFNRLSLAGKLVMINVDDFGRQETFQTPVNDVTKGSIVRATAAANIIASQFIAEGTDAAVINMFVLFLLGGICAFVLPRVTMMYRLIILVGSLVILANVGYFMVSSFGVLINISYFALELILFMAAAPLLDSQLLAGDSSDEEQITFSSRRRMDSSRDIVGSTEGSSSGHDRERAKPARTIERAASEDIEPK